MIRDQRKSLVIALGVSALAVIGSSCSHTEADGPVPQTPQPISSDVGSPAPDVGPVTASGRGTFTLAQNPAWNIVHPSQPEVKVNGRYVSRDCVALGKDVWSGPPAPPAKNVAHRGQVLVVGDSLVLFDQGLRRTLEKAGWSGTIDAVAGRYVYDGIQPLRKAAKGTGVPDTVVVALGTNGKSCPTSGRKKQLKDVLSALGPDRHVIWINSAWDPSASRVAPSTFNDLLTEADSRHPQLSVVDWATKAEELNRTRGNIYQSDGLHLQDWVYKKREAMIVDAIANRS